MVRVAGTVSTEESAYQHILIHAQALKRLCDLKHTRDSKPAKMMCEQAVDATVLIPNLAGRWHKITRHHVEDGRFAGTVWSDDGRDASSGDRNVDTVDGPESAELNGQAFYPKNRQPIAPPFGAQQRTKATAW